MIRRRHENADLTLPDVYTQARTAAESSCDTDRRLAARRKERGRCTGGTPLTLSSPPRLQLCRYAGSACTFLAKAVTRGAPAGVPWFNRAPGCTLHPGATALSDASPPGASGGGPGVRHLLFGTVPGGDPRYPRYRSVMCAPDTAVQQASLHHCCTPPSPYLVF